MGRIKQVVRQECREKRRALPADVRALWDMEITEKLLALPLVQQADAVLCFVGTAMEIDTGPLLLALLTMGKQVYTPRCLDHDGHLDFFQITRLADLEKGLFDLWEPKQSCSRYQGAQHPLCILPGLAFSLEGERLGYGKGYYDRFLSKHRANAVGICYHCFIMEKLPQDDYDQTVDWIVTERVCHETIACAEQDGGKHGE